MVGIVRTKVNNTKIPYVLCNYMWEGLNYELILSNACKKLQFLLFYVS